MIRAFLRGTPWAVPAGVLALVIATAVAWPVVRRLKVRLVPVWLFLTAAGGFLAATVTPSPAAGHWNWRGVTSFAVVLPSPNALHSLNDTSVNVLLGVPLGLAAVWLSGECRRRWPLLVAVALPFLVEAIQALLPLGRSGFQLPDVIANGIGLVSGGVLGVLVVGVVIWLKGWHVPRPPTPALIGEGRHPRSAIRAAQEGFHGQPGP